MVVCLRGKVNGRYQGKPESTLRISVIYAQGSHSTAAGGVMRRTRSKAVDCRIAEALEPGPKIYTADPSCSGASEHAYLIVLPPREVYLQFTLYSITH